MRNDFAIFIMSYNRAGNIATLRTLEKANYTGKYYIIISDDDPQIDKYKETYNNKLYIFNKDKIEPFFDTYTKGLEGTPNEVKLKYLADNNFAHLDGEELKNAIKEHIKNKKDNLVGAMESQGTTPRRLTDLIGSLCDLTSGSGDKGTPIILIQGYFDN